MGSLSRAPGCAKLCGVADERRPQRTKREQARFAIAVAAGVYAVVFALANLDKVKVDWVVASGKTPLIVVIVVCLLIGAGVDRVVARYARKSRKQKD